MDSRRVPRHLRYVGCPPPDAGRLSSMGPDGPCPRTFSGRVGHGTRVECWVISGTPTASGTETCEMSGGRLGYRVGALC